MNAPVNTLRLYQIADKFQMALDAITAQADSDGVIPDTLVAELDALAGTFTEKAINVAAFIRSLEAEAAAIAELKKNFEKRMASLSNQALRLRDYLKAEMERTGILNVNHPWLALRIQVNPPSVVIEDEDRIPDDFKETVSAVKLLKAEIGKALKAGQAVPGAHLEQSSRLVIQ